MAAPRILGGLAIAGTVAVQSLPAAAQVCANLVPPGSAPVVRRALIADDLVRLRDIGAADGVFPDAGSIALSPDGRYLAFQLRQAVAEENAYCLTMLVLPVRSDAIPVMVDHGGELIRATYDFRGKAAFPTGVAFPIAPRWSPDGTWIAFLKRVGSTIQVWRADVNGERSAPVTQSTVDVNDFRIAEDGRSIIYSTRPGLSLALKLIEAEGLVGYHFDERYAPKVSSRPFPAAPIDVELWTENLASKTVRRASDSEAMAFKGATGLPQGALAFVRSPAGRRAWILQSQEDLADGRVRLFIDARGDRPLLCEDRVCRDQVGKIWWTSDGRRLRFFRREGWSREATAVYEWLPGHGSPKRLFLTNDVLADCIPRNDDLVCLRESSVQPREVILLSPSTGTSTVLYDPNPEFRYLALGRVERLRWRNAFGLETFGDVVFPVGYRQGDRYPLIIVQYDSRGFLRGGTGDEYPIQAFANRGYVVLSVNRPQMIGIVRGGKTPTDVERENLAEFAERRSILSALEVGVEQLSARGIVDRERVGLTGLSDGTTTLQFALVNGMALGAAATSSAPWDPGYASLVGPAAAREFAAQGYPKLTEEKSQFWGQFSLARNAGSIRTPILMQLADDEYLGALESFTSLREQGVPTDLFIFPREHHIKWQPAHRLAIYKRNLDWFDFWLKDQSSQLPERQADLARWVRLRLENSNRGPR